MNPLFRPLLCPLISWPLKRISFFKPFVSWLGSWAPSWAGDIIKKCGSEKEIFNHPHIQNISENFTSVWLQETSHKIIFLTALHIFIILRKLLTAFNQQMCTIIRHEEPGKQFTVKFIVSMADLKWNLTIKFASMDMQSWHCKSSLWGFSAKIRKIMT